MHYADDRQDFILKNSCNVRGNDRRPNGLRGFGGLLLFNGHFSLNVLTPPENTNNHPKLMIVSDVMKSIYLSQLLLFKLLLPEQTPAFEGPAAPVVDQPLLGQQVSFLLGLRALHCFFVPGQTLLLLLLGCARVFTHLLNGNRNTDTQERHKQNTMKSSENVRLTSRFINFVLDIYFFDLVFAKPVLLLLAV